MDIVSHGLWGGIAFGRKNRKLFWLSFFFGIAPDFLSFGLYMVGTWTGFFDHPDWRSGQHPDPLTIPLFVHTLYDITHSLVVFALVFGLVWLWRRAPLWPLAAWGLHILVDIPSHSLNFFPTPFLWPLSDYRFDGVSWGHPLIFFPNVFLLILFYALFFYYSHRKKRLAIVSDDTILKS